MIFSKFKLLKIKVLLFCFYLFITNRGKRLVKFDFQLELKFRLEYLILEFKYLKLKSKSEFGNFLNIRG